MKTKFYFLVISLLAIYALFVCLRVIMMKKGM